MMMNRRMDIVQAEGGRGDGKQGGSCLESDSRRRDEIFTWYYVASAESSPEIAVMPESMVAMTSKSGEELMIKDIENFMLCH